MKRLVVVTVDFIIKTGIITFLFAVASLLLSGASTNLFALGQGHAQTSEGPNPPNYSLDATEGMLVQQMKAARDWQAAALTQNARADNAEKRVAALTADLKKARDELGKVEAQCPAAKQQPAPSP